MLSYPGITIATPNESEVEEALRIRLDGNPTALETAGRILLSRLDCPYVVITRGSCGMAVFEREHRTVHVPIFGTDQIADVTGAGDTVIAGLTLALAAGADLVPAACLANIAAGLVVMKHGTAVVTGDELGAALDGST
jgi:rfaE bifunctional protein kinase chain/domain